MLNFASFINEEKENKLSGPPGATKYLTQHLSHLMSTSVGLEKPEIEDQAYALLGEGATFESLVKTINETAYVLQPLLEAEGGLRHPDEIEKRGHAVMAAHAAAHDAENQERLKRGEAPKPMSGARNRMKEGFHAAFPDGEHPDITKSKAKESQEHFRKFMHEEGGHAKDNKLTMLGQNGKTKSSTGVGMNTVGLSISPGTGNRDGEKKRGEFDACPNATDECRKACLGWTAGGNRQYKEISDRAKILRKRYVMEHPEHAARLISHEISENEDWTSKHNTVHNSNGDIVGHKNIKTGKVKSENPKAESHDDVKKKLDSGEYHEKPMKSGVRMNVTSDLQYHRMMPKKFYERHHKSDFYDYTKNHGSLDDKDKPKNLTLGLSHTGDSHRESNSHETIKNLRNGGISAMVYKRGADQPKAKRVKVHGSKEGEDEWKVVDGDSDDNVHTRHESAAQEHDALAKHHHEAAASAPNEKVAQGHKEEAAKHEKIAQEYRDKKRGVVSGLQLKGVKNEEAGHFANSVDKDGTIWLHDHGPQAKLRRTIPIHKG